MNVDQLFPYDPRMSTYERQRTPLPEKLRGIEDRQLAQLIFDGWAESNPETAKRLVQVRNQENWTERTDSR